MLGLGAGWAQVWDCRIPVIAQVHGNCLAGGTDLALHCDIIVAADDARIGFPPVRSMGVPPTNMWLYHLGPQWTKRLLFTGDTVSGAEAASIGLVQEAVPAGRLDEQALALATRIALVGRDLLTANKRVINQGVELMGRSQLQRFAALNDAVAHRTRGRPCLHRPGRRGRPQAGRQRAGRSVRPTGRWDPRQVGAARRRHTHSVGWRRDHTPPNPQARPRAPRPGPCRVRRAGSGTAPPAGGHRPVPARGPPRGLDPAHVPSGGGQLVPPLLPVGAHRAATPGMAPHHAREPTCWWPPRPVPARRSPAFWWPSMPPTGPKPKRRATPAPRSGPGVVYVSPLRALTVDVHENLQRPLAGIAEEARTAGPRRAGSLGGRADRRHPRGRTGGHATVASRPVGDHPRVPLPAPHGGVVPDHAAGCSHGDRR